MFYFCLVSSSVHYKSESVETVNSLLRRSGQLFFFNWSSALLLWVSLVTKKNYSFTLLCAMDI
jgi:hypothetical protein